MANAYYNYLDICMATGSSSVTVTIDKVCIAYDYAQSPQGASELKQAGELMYSVKDGDIPGKVIRCKTAAITQIFVKYPHLAFRMGYGYCRKRYWAWVEFNPSKMDVNGLVQFGAHLSMLFDGAFSSLIKIGRLKRLDIAVDVVHAAHADYMFIDTGLSPGYNSQHFESTTYLGKKGSTRQMCCYDKRRELSEVHGTELPHELLRIEARVMNPKKYAVADFANFGNPFTSLIVVDRKKLVQASSKDVSSFRAMVASGVPADAAFKSFPASQRKQLVKHLKELAPGWWCTDPIWSEYPASLEWINELQ